ncbi:MAG TPA: hypothetical protein VNO18_15490 [Xanthobacteraceae bacterium]|jgi:hypothetical protein|nr:hypothetical protein [Xanthobacteraceae bacterium]
MIRKRSGSNLSTWARRVVAAAIAFTFLFQNFAWAVCADGTTFPAGGFVAGQPPAANWSPGVFTGTAGSIFVPDNSVFEHNDPGQPSTGGGHNWAFDQGSTTCKETDTGPAGGTPTAWAIPPFNFADCFVLPIISNGIICCFGDIPYSGETVTPTCNPALLSQPGAPNPANTRLNQLGCAISHGVATTPQSATTYMFVAGIMGGLFAVPLVNIANPVTGGDAGKIVTTINYYSDIRSGQHLTNAAISPDGMFAIATSIRRSPNVYACLNPLGDPGDPSQPIDPNFVSLPTNQSIFVSQVKCMIVGTNGLLVDLTTAFGPDDQPYFGGQRTVTTFNADPGGSAATAWPQCIFNGFVFANPPPTTLMGKLQAVFNAHSANHCGSAVPNVGFSPLPVVQPQALISHGSYMYSGGTAQPVVQFKVTVDPVSGLSRYAARTYFSGGSRFTTGLGVADDLKSLMVFTDPSGLNLALQEIITKLPLCEDM